MMERELEKKYEVITRQADSYATLLIEIQKYWEREERSLEVVDAQIFSDRYTKTSYYMAVLTKKKQPGKSNPAAHMKEK